jgi:hypothetical protein
MRASWSWGGRTTPLLAATAKSAVNSSAVSVVEGFCAAAERMPMMRVNCSGLRSAPAGYAPGQRGGSLGEFSRAGLRLGEVDGGVDAQAGESATFAGGQVGLVGAAGLTEDELPRAEEFRGCLLTERQLAGGEGLVGLALLGLEAGQGDAEGDGLGGAAEARAEPGLGVGLRSARAAFPDGREDVDEARLARVFVGEFEKSSFGLRNGAALDHVLGGEPADQAARRDVLAERTEE